MKKLIYLWLLLTACTLGAQDKQQRLYLDGEWDFRIDSLDVGISEQWYNEKLPDAIMLPGSMAENGLGDEVSTSTGWTGSIVDRSYFYRKEVCEIQAAG